MCLVMQNGFGGKRSLSGGRSTLTRHSWSEVTKESQLPVHPLCILCDSAVSPSTWNAQGKELWAVSVHPALPVRAVGAERCKPACSCSGCDEAPADLAQEGTVLL